MSLLDNFKSFLFLALTALALTVTAGWVGDYTKDGFEYFIKDWPLIFKVTGSLFVFFAIALFVYKNKEKFTGVRYNKKPEKPKAHKAMIIFLSTAKAEINETEDSGLPVQVTNPKGKSAFLKGNLKDDLTSISEINTAFEMVLKAYDHHKSELSHIALIASKDGSANLIKAYGTLFKIYTPNIKVYPRLNEINESPLIIDINKFDETENAINYAIKILKDENLKNNDIIIDITGGPKTTSIAGAFASLLHPGLEFQYINTNDTKHITGFDMGLQSKDSSLN